MSDLPPRPSRILVTGVGGAPGLDLARALTRLGRHVITADADPLAAGLHLPEVTPVTLPPAQDPGYQAALLRVCRDHAVEAVLPGIEAELPYLAAAAPDLRRLGVRTWLPSADAIACCGDKAAFAARLTRAGIPAPDTWLPHEVPDDCGRVVVKPRRGHGSQNTYFCHTARQARVLCELVPDPIVQEEVAGQEFTADCLIDHDGRASVILRRRLRVKGGLAVVAETFTDTAVQDQVRRTLAAVGAAGVCCAQGFITDDASPGRRVLMSEVNLRIAGAHTASVEAGADLVGQLLVGLAGLPVDHDRLTYKPTRVIKFVETLNTRRTTP